MGLKGQQVLDPVFLLEKSEWSTILSEKRYRRKYCVVYALVEYAFSDDTFIKKYAKKNECDVIILPINRRNQSTFYKKCYEASPGKVISLIKNAECVFTNSFHGAAFSIIFEKQFYLLNNISKEAQSKEGRLDSMLNMFGISSRRIGEVSDVIDYAKVNSKLKSIKESSQEYLDGNL